MQNVQLALFSPQEKKKKQTHKTIGEQKNPCYEFWVHFKHGRWSKPGRSIDVPESREPALHGAIDVSGGSRAPRILE